MRRIAIQLTHLVALLLLVAACADDPGAETTTIAPIALTTTTSTAPATTATPTTESQGTTTTTVAETTTTVAEIEGDVWIAVLASLSVDEYDEAAADDEMAAIRDALGLTALEVDLLLSDDYPTLNPGFWVVHLGGFRDEFQADEACGTVESGVPDCYTRYLSLISPEQAVGHAEGYLLAVLETGALAVVDTRTGDAVRIVDEVFYGDGRFPSAPSIRPGGTEVYFTVGFEDFWFSCDASDGTLIAQSIADEGGEQVADGFSPIVSADGGTLVYLAASECLEDPNDANWVITPIDTIVRRDLESGEERRQQLELTGDIAEYYEFVQVAFGPGSDLLLLDTEGTVFVVDDETSDATPLVELEHVGVTMLGWYAPADVLFIEDQIWEEGEASTEIVAVDIATGETTVVEAFDVFATASLDATGSHLVIGGDGFLQVDGERHVVPYSVLDLSW